LPLNRMENALLGLAEHSQIAQDKAYTRSLGKMPTLSWKEQYHTGEKLVPLLFPQPLDYFCGWLPYYCRRQNPLVDRVQWWTAHGGYLRGQAALKAGGFRIEDADDIIAAAAKATTQG